MDNDWTTRLRFWIKAIDVDDMAAIWPDDVEAALDEIERLHSENTRLLNDRARFPDRPDDVGRMIEAHLTNLRALRVEADKRVSRLRDENERLQAELAAARELAAGMDDGGRVAAQEYATLRAACEEAESEWRNVAQEVKRQDAQIDALRADVDRLATEHDETRDALRGLEQAEAYYRWMYYTHGAASIEAGRAWDRMRRAGDEARRVLGEEG